MNLDKPNYKHYTVGFAFSEDLQKVCLIKKCKPQWQDGLLNGVGGRIEEGEAIVDCMEREFFEEAGVRIRGWKHFLTGDIKCHQGDCIVHYFVVLGHYFTPSNVPEEQVDWYYITDVLDGTIENIVPNLLWMIPIALLKLTNFEWSEPAEWQTI